MRKNSLYRGRGRETVRNSLSQRERQRQTDTHTHTYTHTHTQGENVRKNSLSQRWSERKVRGIERERERHTQTHTQILKFIFSPEFDEPGAFVSSV